MAETTEADRQQETKRSQLNTQEFIALALKRWQMAADAEAEWRKLALDDLKFSIGEQWPDKVKTARERRNKPCLTFNRIGQAIKQVTNNQRQQRPAIQINPAGSGSTKEVADILQGIVRHIEVQSDAEVAYDIAFDYMARCGKGFFRLRTEYVDDIDDDGDEDTQEIIIEPILNSLSVYSDPRAVKPDKSDCKFKFIVEDIPHEEYKAQYKDSELADLRDMSSVGDKAPEWISKETIRVAEYFYLETTEVKGKTGKGFKETLKWAKINAVEILDERELKEKFIPIIEVVGDDLVIDGDHHIAGMVRDAKDPCRSYNYHVSKAAEVVALAPLAPYIGWKGQFTDPKWETANVEDFAYLEADPVNIEGLPTPSLPQRNNVEPPIQAIAMMVKQADNDIKAVTGIYDASLGERGPDESGKAILQRKQQGDVANFNYTDNLARAIRFTGKVLLNMIPIYYDAPRVQRIIHPDSSVEHVGIYNSKAPGMGDYDPTTDPDFAQIKKVYDIGLGRYDVTVSVGPSFQTKRQEAAAMQLELMKNVPIVQQAAPDILIRNMDIPGGDVVADRVKKLLPPALQDEGDGTPEARAAAAESKLAVLSAQHDQLTQALQQAQEEIRTKKVETDARVQIAALQVYGSITVAEINTKSQKDKVRSDLEADELERIHQGAQDASDKAHEVAMAAMQQAHAKELAQQGADNQSALSAQNAAQAASAQENQPEEAQQ